MSSIDNRETWLYRSTLGALSEIGCEDDTLSIREGIIEINEDHISQLSVERCHIIASYEDMSKKTKENILDSYALVQKGNKSHKDYCNSKTPPTGTSSDEDLASGFLLYVSLFSSNALLYSLVLLSNESIYLFLDLSSFPPSSVFLITSIAAGVFCFIGGIMGDHFKQRLVMLKFSFALVPLSSLSFLCSLFFMQDALKMLSLLLWIASYGFSVPNLEVVGVQEASCPTSKSRVFIYYFASSTMVAFVFQTILSLGKISYISLLNVITFGLYICVASLFRFIYLRLDKSLVIKKSTTGSIEVTSAVRHVKCLMSQRNVIYAILSLLFVMIGSVGTILSLSIKEDKKIISITQSRGQIAFVSFGLIFSVWLVVLLLTMRCLCVESESHSFCKYLASCRHDTRKVMVLVSTVSVVALTAFIRAQLSIAIPIQICQTDLTIPGAKVIGAFFPDSATVVFELSSLIVAGGLLLLNFRLKRIKNLLEYGIVFYVFASFVSSIVELYRRRSKIRLIAVLRPETLDWFPERCAAASSEVSFLWVIPYLVIFAIANTCFRTHVQEIMYDFSQANTWAREWTGTAMGLLYLAHSIGYMSAFSLSNAISSWLFHQGGSDSVVYLLITTTIASLSYAVNKKIIGTYI